MISIITPWHNCPELIPDYEAAVYGAQVVVISNNNDDALNNALLAMVARLGNGSLVIRKDGPFGFSEANNFGMGYADGEIVVFMNADVVSSGDWLPTVAQAKPNALYGASDGFRFVDGAPTYYLEGWCIYGHKRDFERIGGWNDKDFPGIYWEDNEICWRAGRAGLAIKHVDLPLEHLGSRTNSITPGAYARAAANHAVFEQIVRRDRAF